MNSGSFLSITFLSLYPCAKCCPQQNSIVRLNGCVIKTNATIMGNIISKYNQQQQFIFVIVKYGVKDIIKLRLPLYIFLFIFWKCVM